MIGLGSKRISRAFFGVLSIWCLGCTSLDIVIDRLAHGDVTAVDCMMGDETPAPPAHGAPAARPLADASALAICGCEHCVAVESRAIALALPPQPTPESIEQTLAAAISIDREPFVPPPIARTST